MSKTLDNLHKALAKVNGYKESVAVIYCDNEEKTYQAGFVGDTDATCAGIQCLLDHVGEMRATPGEAAIARAIIVAVAATDIRQHGAILEAIKQHRDQIETAQQELKPKGDA